MHLLIATLLAAAPLAGAKLQQDAEERARADVADLLRVLCPEQCVLLSVRDNPASLEKLLDLFQKAGESTHITEVIELLAHASVQSGDLARARDLYQRLTTMEPGNPLHIADIREFARRFDQRSHAGSISCRHEGGVRLGIVGAAGPVRRGAGDNCAQDAFVVAKRGRLIVCGIADPLWGTLLVTGLDKVFTFCEDLAAALASLQMQN